MKPTDFFKRINLIYFALIVGITAFSIIVFVTSNDLKFTTPTTSDTYVFIVPAGCIFGIAIGKFMYNKLTASLTPDKPIEQKIQVLTSAIIVRLALAEGPALLSIISVMESKNLFYYIFTGFMLLIFATLKPNREKLSKKLHLTSSEKEITGIKDNYRQ